MNRFLVGYATSEAHTAAIAGLIARRLGSLGHTAYLLDVAVEERSVDPLHGCNAVILAASVRRGSHEPEMIAFVKRNFDQITAWPSAFLSISQSHVAQNALATGSERAKDKLEVETAVDAFVEETGWEPGRVKPVPDSPAHTKYGVIRRWLLKGIARGSGVPRKRLRDPDSTHWDDLDVFVDDLVESLAHHGEAEPSDLLMSHVPSRSAD